MVARGYFALKYDVISTVNEGMMKGKHSQFPTLHHFDDGPYDAMLTNQNEHTHLGKCVMHSLQGVSISGTPSIRTSHLAGMPICWVTFGCIVSLGSGLWSM